MSEFKTYREYEADWQRDRHSTAAGRRKRVRIRGAELIGGLERLARDTGDRRFNAALDAIRELGLVDEAGKWRRADRKITDPESIVYAAELVVPMVDEVVATGLKPRVAYARVAAYWTEEAPSFSAACDRVERTYQSARSTVRDMGSAKT